MESFKKNLGIIFLVLTIILGLATIISYFIAIDFTAIFFIFGTLCLPFSIMLLKKYPEEKKLEKIFDNRQVPENEKLKPEITEEKEINENEIKQSNENIKKIDTGIFFFMVYEDVYGTVSKRRININTIKPDDDFQDCLIYAFCYEREAMRSFRASRILELADMDTGEIIENPVKYFLDRYSDTPLGKINNIFEIYSREILILTFIARADGVLRKKERNIICNFLNAKSDKNLNESLLDKEIKRVYCEYDLFRKVLKDYKKESNEKKEELLKLADEIIKTDKEIDPIEIAGLELIKKIIK